MHDELREQLAAAEARAAETEAADLNNTNTCIIPRKCISELKRILSTYNDESGNLITIGINSRNLLAKTSNYVIKSKLIEGKYPDYRKVFPEKLPHIIVDFKKSLYEKLIMKIKPFTN